MNTSADFQSILMNHLGQYRQKHSLSARERQVLWHIAHCRTPMMGGLRLTCSDCSYVKAHYHACRDRHCPKCQRVVSKRWCETQREHLLPVTYHHLVFTLPSQLNGWISQHPRCLYDLLFQSAWHTLKNMGRDPKRLNGQIGATAVLHTWGENLSRHVHLHCLVPGGALDSEGRWQAAGSHYLFPVRALSRLFRGVFVSRLRQAKKNGQLNGIRSAEVTTVLNALMKKDWVVFSKPCATKARTVVDYLGRYSHRIAISDQRIESVENGQVRFSVKDYRHQGERRCMILGAEEFIRRYLLHVLPKGLMRIRHYGFLANRCREKLLREIRDALSVELQQKTKDEKPFHDYVCPRCGCSELRRVGCLPEQYRPEPRLAEA